MDLTLQYSNYSGTEMWLEGCYDVLIHFIIIIIIIVIFLVCIRYMTHIYDIRRDS